MFESFNFSKSLDEGIFESWLEKGRSSLLGYHYLLIVWNMMEGEYKPIYISNREEIQDYKNALEVSEILIAAYDLYSESKISIETH